MLAYHDYACTPGVGDGCQEVGGCLRHTAGDGDVVDGGRGGGRQLEAEYYDRLVLALVVERGVLRLKCLKN